tara:strand:+ start:2443 stop:3390 length:948 start_codon:yes stop_codon:yes gene_type:complete
MKLENLENKGCRDGYGEALVELGKKDKNTIAMCGDLEGSTRAKMFQKEFPDRFFTAGIAEQNLVNVAAGLSLVGFVPHVSSFGVFTLRAIEQVRNTISVSDLNVKIAGSHCGINVGKDGPTQMGLEEISIYRALPNFIVLWPCDANQTYQATLAMHKHKGPVYIQWGRDDTPVITKKNEPFKIGKAQIFQEGTDVTLIASGSMVHPTLVAAEALKKKNISAEVINIHTIKPIDEPAIIKSAKKTGAVITAEDHQKFGGLRSVIAEVLSSNQPTIMDFVAVDDVHAESGSSTELFEKYGLTVDDIVKKAEDIISKK